MLNFLKFITKKAKLLSNMRNKGTMKIVKIFYANEFCKLSRKYMFAKSICKDSSKCVRLQFLQETNYFRENRKSGYLRDVDDFRENEISSK